MPQKPTTLAAGITGALLSLVMLPAGRLLAQSSPAAIPPPGQEQVPLTGNPSSDGTSATGATPSAPAAASADSGAHLGPGQHAFGRNWPQAAADSEQRPPYKLLRYDEDYRFLKDPCRRTDFWDPIKYIPINCREDAYLSVGGEIRERFEVHHNEDFGAAPNRNGYNLDLVERYLLHGDLHLSPYFRVFGQIGTGLEDWRIGGPRAGIDRDAFAIRQGFADIVLPLCEKDTLTLRVGRQEFAYGSGRLIDLREGPNLLRAFDAARFLLRAGDWALDGFWSKPVRNQNGVFDDDPDPQHTFWGFYAVHPLAPLPDGHADLYYLGYENKNAIYNKGAGYELRNSLGTRIWGRPMPWEYNIEGVWQFGRFGPGNIEAWAIYTAVRYNFNDMPLRPRFGVRADVESGDRNRFSPNLQTFNPLFPTGDYFNLADPMGPLNDMNVHPVLDLHFGENVQLSLDWDFFWRTSLQDGIYRISGSPTKPSGQSNARFVGSSPAVTVAWKPTSHLMLLASYVHIFAGPFVKETPPSKDADYVTTWIDYRF